MSHLEREGDDKSIWSIFDSDRGPSPGKPGGLNRSVQHLLAVYLPEFEIPKVFLDADLSAAPPHRVLLENTLTSLFS
jgi:hypothetical protein